MITHELTQGAPEWHAYRADHDNASDAPAMLGASSYKTRDELIAERATGITPEVNTATQRLFDSGHRFEALARPLAEKIIGEDLYPVTGSEGRLSASFDGLTMLEDVAFEHKRLNARLRAAFTQIQEAVSAGTLVDGVHKTNCAAQLLPEEYQIQMEQQCAVSGCEKVLFMASIWDDQDNLIEEQHCWYTPNLELRALIAAGWEQFHKDVAAYELPEAPAAPVVAEPMESLPAVSVRLDGRLAVVSNLPDFTTALRAFIARIPAKPETDQDFANAEGACKALKRAEDALTAGEESALAEMTDFEAMRRQVRDLKELARATRLATEKQVAARKEAIRGEIVASGVAVYRAHIDSLNQSLGRHYMPSLPVDFGGAVKGKRTIDSLQGAVNDELARAKIAAGEVYTRIQCNLKALHSTDGIVLALFPDMNSIVLKACDDFAALVQARMAQHQAAEQQRMDAERERIRSEEVAKLAREADAKARAEAAELARQQREQAAAQQQAAAAIAQAAAPVQEQAPVRVCAQSQAEAAPVQVDDEGRINLSAINLYLAPIKLDAAGLSALGFEPVEVVKASKLYRASSMTAIRAALIEHLTNMHEMEAA